MGDPTEPAPAVPTEAADDPGYSVAAALSTKQHVDVSPVCIRQEVREKTPTYKVIVPPADDESDGEADDPMQRALEARTRGKKKPPKKNFLVDNSCLKSPGKGILYRKSKAYHDVAPKEGVSWKTIVSGIDTGDGWLKCGAKMFLPKKINGVPVLILSQSGATNAPTSLLKKLMAAQDDADGLMFSVDIVRNVHGETGFSLWPDHMTICCKDSTRTELVEMKENDIVYAVDGFRTATHQQYLDYARGVHSFTMTLLRHEAPFTDVMQDPCPNPACGETLCMVGAVFCPQCGTRRPQRSIVV